MSEFNERTALNLKLQQDEAETFLNRIQAKRRQSARRINRTFRKYVTIVAIDAALAGSMLTAGVAALACLVL